MVSVLEHKGLNVDGSVTSDAKSVIDSRGSAKLVLRTSTGEEIELPKSVQKLLTATLSAVARGKRLQIEEVPDELSSTVAADMIGVSRPTLLKCAASGEIDSFKVGSHTRFRREDVAAFKQERIERQRNAFEELRRMDSEAGIDE